jgi:hypothetical protein
MAEYGEWNRKGAVLSDVTAQKEYGIARKFIETGIRAGKLEYREGAVWGNPYLRVLRSQLELYIVEGLAPNTWQARGLRPNCTKKETTSRRTKLATLEARVSVRLRLSFDSGRSDVRPTTGISMR